MLPTRGPRMDWFGWRLSKDPPADHAAISGPQAIIRELEKRVPHYLDDADQGRLILPACKRTVSDAHGDVRSIWDHTRLESIRYVAMVPGGAFALLAEPARQPDILEAYLRQRPHDDTVIEFTGATASDLAIATIAGFNWLNYCAGLAGADRGKFSGTLSNFRKTVASAQQWWAAKGAEERCARMLAEHEKPPLMFHLIWTDYTRLAKEVASAAFFGSFVEQAIGRRRAVLNREFAVPPGQRVSGAAELTKTMADFAGASDPDALAR